MLATVNNLLANKQIPPLDAVQMQDLLQYLFTTAEKMLRIQVAEAVYRDDHGHPSALDVFLACTLPLAEKAAHRRAHKLFLYPSDWQLELMYDGAVTTMIDVFQHNYAVRPGTDCFRRYLVRALALGTVRSYFMRKENDEVRPVANLAIVPTRKRPCQTKSSRTSLPETCSIRDQFFPTCAPCVPNSAMHSRTRPGSCSERTRVHGIGRPGQMET